MRDGEKRRSSPYRHESPSGTAVQLQLRRTAAAHDLDVLPEDTGRMTGAERLHCGLLRGEAAGKVNGGYAASGAVSDFAVRENAPQKPVAVALDGFGDPVDVGRVE